MGHLSLLQHIPTLIVTMHSTQLSSIDKEARSVSQQEMQFESTQQSESKTYDSGYEAFPHYNNDYAFPPFNQKIAGQEEQNARESAHLREHILNLRMGMAITSLVFWMIF